jgi:hypothetical protein
VAAVWLSMAAPSPLAADQRYSAERFDVTLRVDEAGTLHVTERVVFRFEEGEFTRVFREIPLGRIDNISSVTASIDGRTAPRGDGPGEVQTRRRDRRLQIWWHFAPTIAATREFTLGYTVRGAIERTEDGGWLAWRALPTEHRYGIDRSEITIEAPRADRPRIESRRAAAVSVEPAGSAWRVVAERIERNGWVEVRVPLPGLAAPEPVWQQRRDAQRAALPRILMFAGLAGVLCLVAIASVRFQFPGAPAVNVPGGTETGPPDSLSPVLAAAVLNGGRASGRHGVAGLFELADAGAIVIEESRGALGIRRFVARPSPAGHATAGYQSALIDALLTKQGEPTETDLSKAASRLLTGGKPFREAVAADLGALGLLDENRRSVRRRLLTLGWILAGMTAASVPLLLLLGLGPLPFIVSLVTATGAAVALIMGLSLPELSDEGYRRRARWRAFRGALRDAARGRGHLPGSEAAGRYLAYAVAFGLAGQWSRWMKKHGATVQLPRWFTAAAGQEHDAAFAAMLGAMAAGSGSGGSGGASGGAGGGGSSGAN